MHQKKGDGSASLFLSDKKNRIFSFYPLTIMLISAIIHFVA